jgi:WD40 repeat protein
MSSEAPISAVDIEQAAKRFEGAWQRGEQPVISDYCKEAGPRSSALLQALVVIDLEYRLKSGQRRWAEDYLREFPQLQAHEQAILKLLRIESRWNVGEPPASTGAGDESSNEPHSDDVDVKSCGAAIETAASGADLSVIAATRTSPGDSFSQPNFSGETVSAHDLPSPARPPAVRTLGKFRLIDAVGQGGFGTVFRAIDTSLGRVVAVKVPKAGLLGSEKEQERFLREAQSAAALRHDHIVTVYEVGGTAERPFIVSALVSGCPLSKALASRRFEPREAATIVRDVANALHYAHERGVIHRDVKPSNIMLDDLGKPFLMDFGLARRDGEALITVAGQILGTPAYMSPEQAEGRRADARTDVYSMGVVLYELLTGERPFRGNVQSVLHQVINAQPRSPMVANRDVPRDLEKICLKCIQKAPDDRYASAGELADDLSRFLEGLPVRARPISPVARGWRWASRHPKTAILIAVAVALGVSLPVVRIQLDEARESARRADKANRERLAKLFVSKGDTSLDAGDSVHALPWFAAALNQLPAGAFSYRIHRIRLVTAMNESCPAQMWLVGGPINSVSRQPNGRLLAIGSTAKTATLLDPFNPSLEKIVLPHTEALWQCAFSPDGTRLATFCNDGVIRIWLTSSLSSHPFVLDQDNHPVVMIFDPTSRLLASATRGGSVRIWDVATGTLREPVLAHRADVGQLTFNEDGSLLATACADGAVHLWSVTTRKELAPALPHEGPVNCVAFAPNGGLLYSGGVDGAVRAWDVKSHAPKFEFRVGSPVLHLVFSADGTRVAAGCRDGGVHVWNLQTRQSLPGDFRHEQRVSALSFSKDGKTLVTGSLDKTVRVWDLTTLTLLAPPFVCADGITWAEVTDDHQHLMSAGFDGFLREWRLRGPFRAEQRCTDMGALSIVQLSPNGRWLLLTGERQSAQLCDLSGSEPTALSLPDSSSVHRAAFGCDGNRLVLARNNGDLDLWDVSERPKRIRVHTGAGALNDVGFSTDSQSLLTANADGTARVFSIVSGGIRLALPHGHGLKRALFSSDGQKIYTAGGNRSLCVWDVGSGTLLSELQHSVGQTDNIEDCRLTPDGRFVLAIRHGQPAIVCNASTGAFIRSSNLVTLSAAFSDEGTRFVAIGTNHAVVTWDMSTGKQVAAPLSQRGDTTSCAIRGDGALIATGSDDATARVWDAETGEPVSPPLKHTDRVIFVGFREAGNQLVTVSADAVTRLWTLDDGTPTERLIHLARATSGQEIDDGVAVALKPKEIQAEWEAAQTASSPDSQ